MRVLFSVTTVVALVSCGCGDSAPAPDRTTDSSVSSGGGGGAGTGGSGGGARADAATIPLPGTGGAGGASPASDAAELSRDANPGTDASRADDTARAPDANAAVVDAAPVSTYPAGPYGLAVGNTMLNASFTMRDGATIALGDLRALPGTKVIVWSSGAEWCTVCRSKVASLKKLQTDKGPAGVVVIESLHQSSNFTPANAATIDRWNQQYQVNYRLVVEKSPPYAAQTQNPVVWVIDAATMKIRAREQYSSADVGPEVDAALAAAGR